MARIHQFSPALADGDGVSGGVLFTQALLRELGHTSTVYCAHGMLDVRPQAQHLSAFDNADCDLLLVHHSMGHDLENWLAAVRCPQVLVYHNITPAEFFGSEAPERHYAELGRAQLRSWRGNFNAAVGVSQLNTQELGELGYAPLATLPLVSCQARLQGVRSRPPAQARALAGRALLLCVGRIAENKRQHLLLEALWHLQRWQAERDGPAPLLVVAGGTTTPAYRRQLEGRALELGVEQSVLFAGKCPDAELRWYYEQAQAFWCASAHEGFCIPLLEAQSFELPVLAFGSSNIPDTLGAGGLLLEQPCPAALAAATAQLLQDAALAAALRSAGTHNLQRYAREHIRAQLAAFVEPLLCGAAA